MDLQKLNKNRSSIKDVFDSKKKKIEIAGWVMKQERLQGHGVATRIELNVYDLICATRLWGHFDAAQHHRTFLELNRGGPHAVRLSTPCSHRVRPHH